MKANEAPKSKFVYPDKLYARCKDNKTLDISYAPQTLEAVEYIKTDTFIEKALKWYCLDCECNDNCKDSKCFFHNEFKRHLEGNEHAIPPKFETAILNPDGSTSDNWRYRHFTNKMQDAFIEKAAKWVKERAEMFLLKTPIYDYYDYKKAVMDFRKYMKG